MSVISVAKNQFFTHFSVVDREGTTLGAKYREREQVWNAKGIAIKVQGNDWNGGYNGFGKRHLLTTEGGKHGGEVNGFKLKMASVLAKRMGNPGQARGKKLTNMATAQAPLKVGTGKEAAENHKLAVLGMRNTTATHYEVNPYGDKLGGGGQNTMILLDGLTLKEVAETFADAINAEGPFTAKEVKHVTIRFADARVYVLSRAMIEPDAFPAVEVGVCFDGAIYHVYHCYGASL